jgi:hypothetical protein
MYNHLSDSKSDPSTCGPGVVGGGGGSMMPCVPTSVAGGGHSSSFHDAAASAAAAAALLHGSRVSSSPGGGGGGGGKKRKKKRRHRNGIRKIGARLYNATELKTVKYLGLKKVQCRVQPLDLGVESMTCVSAIR